MSQHTADLAAALASMSGLELLRAMTALPDPPPTIGGLLGFEVEEVEHGRVSFSLTALGTVIHGGRSTATAKGRVHDDAGRLVAHATTTCIILR